MSISYAAKVILDSVQPDGVRLTTMEVTFPKFILAEFNTHRQFSRNSASSRAIPFEKMVQRVMESPVLPVWWGKNQAGMQAKEELDDNGRQYAIRLWLEARDEAVRGAQLLAHAGVHKQIVNRLIEPWVFTTVIVSSTSYAHFFALRCHPDAQPEMRHTAELMREAYRASTPLPAKFGDWHAPYLYEDDQRTLDEMYHAEIRSTGRVPGNQGEWIQGRMLKLSVARCARVSYLTHDGKRDLQADLDLHDKLAASGHWSPFEHVAEAVYRHSHDPAFPSHGNFAPGWAQYRKTFAGECTP